MPDFTEKLHLLCGYAASGKSTLAAELARSEGALVLSEDVWLAALYADELRELADFVRRSAKLRQAMGPHVVALLQAGQRVVLDFHGNTAASRAWAFGLARDAGVKACLHHLEVPLEVCRRRVVARNADGTHAFQLTLAQFDRLTAYFQAPDPAEGVRVITHRYSE